MAVIDNISKEISYENAVIGFDEHYWLDGMLQEYAIVWDSESKTIKRVTVGYYGIDAQNLAGKSARKDLSAENAREIIKFYKPKAMKAFCDSVIKEKQSIKKGMNVVVTRGRKVKIGTKLSVFWTGNKPTWRSKNVPNWHYASNETEEIAGCFDENGNKVWIKTEYLKSLDKVKSPKSSERRKYIKWWLEKNLDGYILEMAKK